MALRVRRVRRRVALADGGVGFVGVVGVGGAVEPGEGDAEEGGEGGGVRLACGVGGWMLAGEVR